MVLDRKADFAAIDSNSLQYYLLEHPEVKKNLKVLTSFGPMPIYPVVFNSRLPGKIIQGQSQSTYIIWSYADIFCSI